MAAVTTKRRPSRPASTKMMAAWPPEWPGDSKKGARRARVKVWQRVLAWRLDKTLPIDGIFGDRTNHLLVTWQVRYPGARNYGVADQYAYNSLVNTNPKPAPPKGGVPPYPGVSSMGDKDKARVMGWQRLLQWRVDSTLKVDGIYGQRTNHCLTRWQQDHPDARNYGLADQNAWNSLLNENPKPPPPR
jgi:hypothetical protein